MDVVVQAIERDHDDIAALSTRFYESYIADLQINNNALDQHRSTMNPTFIDKFPIGNERGLFAAMDLGGTNFRVAIVELNPSSSLPSLQSTGGYLNIIKLQSWNVPDNVKQGVSKDNDEDSFLFDWMAKRVQNVIQLIEPPNTGIWYMGASFSFQLEHTSVNTATVKRMGKGFSLPSVEGANFHHLVQEAFRKRNLPIKVSAIVNDGVATLLAASFINPTTRLSIILGTGTNATCPVSIDRLQGRLPHSLCLSAVPSHSSSSHSPSLMLLNTEWSFYGAGFLPTTNVDAILDAHVRNFKPWSQPFEQRISGLYLGELFRLGVIEAITWNNSSTSKSNRFSLLGGRIPRGFETPWSVKTEYMALLETDLKHARSALTSSFDFHNSKIPTQQDLIQLRGLAKAISTRSAKLLGAALVAMINLATSDQTELKHLTIAINGSVIENYPGYQQRLRQSMRMAWNVPSDDDSDVVISPTGMHVFLHVANEGGVVGAAVAACLYAK